MGLDHPDEKEEKFGKIAIPESRQEYLKFLSEITDCCLPAGVHKILLEVTSGFLDGLEHKWQQSKQEAIEAVSAGLMQRLRSAQREIDARDATVSSIGKYFEALVAELTDRANSDPKTRLMNFRRFHEQLEALLALEQRSRWSAVGLVDITSFKWYNDNLGHAIGDQIIDRVAELLRHEVRPSDLLVQAEDERREERPVETEQRNPALHGRFGGDEFCFCIPDLAKFQDALVIAERFRNSVASYEWHTVDPRLAERPVNVDVGVVIIELGSVIERRPMARLLAHELLARADKLMYEAKGERANHVYAVQVRIEGGRLVEVPISEDGV